MGHARSFGLGCALILGSAVGIATVLRCQVAGPAAGAKHRPVVVNLRVPSIRSCPARTDRERSQLFERRLQACSARIELLLGPLPPAAPPRTNVRIAILMPEEHFLAEDLCQRRLHGFGILAFERRSGLLAPNKKQRDDQALHCAVVHMLTQQLVHDALPRDAQNRLGYGWLATGLAHRLEAELCRGLVQCCMVGETVMPPATVWGGDWRRAAFELLRRGQLPTLEQLLVTDAADFDLGQHVLTLALIDWLLREVPLAPQTGAPAGAPASKRSALAQMLAAAAAGKSAKSALPEILGRSIQEIEADVHAFVRKRAGVNKPNRKDALPHHPSHPHAAMFVYTREPIRARHRRIVEKALKQRHRAHTSGWQKQGTKPLLSVGPVNRLAGFWHGDELVKNIARTWPMVAVLEYEPTGKPTAYLDCLRRVAGRQGNDGWMLDPGVGFVPHHNAQIVTDRDKTWHYLAIPDTPTGSHVGHSEFVHRGRLRWSDGRTATLGVWTTLHAPKSNSTEPWQARQVPLVDWFVSERNRGLGAKAFSMVPDRQRDLAVWGTHRVFRFPVIPAGLTAGR